MAGSCADAVGDFRRRQEDLQSPRDVFAPSAFALAASDRYLNFDDHRSPHDALRAASNLSGPSLGACGEKRSLSLNVPSCAYHDRYIEPDYRRAFRYALNLEKWQAIAIGARTSFVISDEGHAAHEIEQRYLDEIGVWVIEALDLQFRGVPKL